MSLPSIHKARLYKTAWCPEHECYVSLEGCWYDANHRIVYECAGTAYEGSKWFLHTELTKHCL